MQANLFLAPGEGDAEPIDLNGEKMQPAGGRGDTTLPDAINLIRGQTN